MRRLNEAGAARGPRFGPIELRAARAVRLEPNELRPALGSGVGSLARALVLSACLTACAAPTDPLGGDPLSDARTYETDASARRSAMEESVAAASTPYAALRLEHYALSGAGIDDAANDWDALPVFSPSVRRMRVRGGTATDESLDAGPVIDAHPEDLAGYVAAGERAFERYPVQIDLALAMFRDRATAERLGLVVEPDGIVRGLVEVETDTGWNVALTCAACHGAERDGTFVLGLPNERLDLGSLLGRLDWPLGTMDVTDDAVDAPLRPADLRPLASQVRLQHTGNLHNGRIARMVRIETLAITQLGARFRPPRALVASIALYLESLDAALPRPDASAPAALTFERTCAGCHAGDALAGGIVEAAVVLTDARATTGGQRGTGGYRAPSLLGVRDRRAVLHDGSASSLRGLLGLEPSGHVGHPFGLGLDPVEREDLATWLDASR